MYFTDGIVTVRTDVLASFMYNVLPDPMKLCDHVLLFQDSFRFVHLPEAEHW